MRVASCLYFASYELHLLCELRVASCTYYASCELQVERKVRVGNSKVRVETKSASCLFSFVERPFSSNKKGILKSHFNLQLFFWVFVNEKHFYAIVTFLIRSHL